MSEFQEYYDTLIEKIARYLCRDYWCGRDDLCWDEGTEDRWDEWVDQAKDIYKIMDDHNV